KETCRWARPRRVSGRTAHHRRTPRRRTPPGEPEGGFEHAGMFSPSLERGALTNPAWRGICSHARRCRALTHDVGRCPAGRHFLRCSAVPARYGCEAMRAPSPCLRCCRPTTAVPGQGLITPCARTAPSL